MTREELAKLVGGNIATERGNRGHKQAWLANQAGLRRGSLSRYENGHELATLLVLVRISDALGCPLVALLAGLVDEAVGAS